VSEAEFVEPSPHARAAAVVIFALGFGSMFALHLGWPLLMTHIRSLAVCEQVNRFALLVALQALLLAVIPLLLWRYAARAHASRRWPAPGQWVLRRTPLRRGDAAQRIVLWLRVAALAFALIDVAIVAVLARLIVDVATRWHCLA
jgi:hypothetical protein